MDAKRFRRCAPASIRAILGNIDEGWTRLIFDDFGLPYTSVLNADIQAGNLSAHFDTIILPDSSRGQIVQGYAQGAMPPEYTGGLGEKGKAALKEFVEAGGTLILLNQASDYGSQDLGIKATNVVRGVESKDFYSPGSLLNMTLDTKSPLAYGMPANLTLWSEQSPAWDAPQEVCGGALSVEECAGFRLAARREVRHRKSRTARCPHG